MRIVVLHVSCVCLFAYHLLFLPAIKSNDTECTEESEVYEYQEEEDQGQVNQGQPSIRDAYLILITHFVCFLKVYKSAYFHVYCYSSHSNYCWLSSTSQIVIIRRDNTFGHLFNTPFSNGLMLSIKAFGKLLAEPKTLRWEHSKKHF
jgi:hypothetical protein